MTRMVTPCHIRAQLSRSHHSLQRDAVMTRADTLLAELKGTLQPDTSRQ